MVEEDYNMSLSIRVWTKYISKDKQNLNITNNNPDLMNTYGISHLIIRNFFNYVCNI